MPCSPIPSGATRAIRDQTKRSRRPIRPPSKPQSILSVQGCWSNVKTCRGERTSAPAAPRREVSPTAPWWPQRAATVNIPAARPATMSRSSTPTQMQASGLIPSRLAARRRGSECGLGQGVGSPRTTIPAAASSGSPASITAFTGQLAAADQLGAFVRAVGGASAEHIRHRRWRNVTTWGCG